MLRMKMARIHAVEAEEVPDQSLLANIQDGLRCLALPHGSTRWPRHRRNQ
jgi:hypothetical protein